MITGSPSLGANGHWRRCEVLHLLEVKTKWAHLFCQVCHILFATAWMTADEIGNNLLTESCSLTGAVEYGLELVELAERGFAHQLKYMVFSMFWCHLQASANVLRD